MKKSCFITSFQINCETYPIVNILALKLPLNSQCIVVRKVDLFQMLVGTSICTLLGKVLLSQKCQNDVLCGNINMDVSPSILKFKFFFKNTCSKMTAWIHVGQLQTKNEMIYLHKTFCLVIVYRNKTHIPVMSCCHKHKHQRYHNESSKISMFILYMYVDIPFLSNEIAMMFEHVTTLYQILQIWIGHNAVR